MSSSEDVKVMFMKFLGDGVINIIFVCVCDESCFWDSYCFVCVFERLLLLVI